MQNSVKYKMLGLISFFMFLLLLTSAYAIFDLKGNINQYEQLINKDIHQNDRLQQISIHFKEQVQSWKNLLIRGSNDKQQQEHYFTEFKSNKLVIDKLFAEIDSHEDNLEIKNKYKEASDAYNIWYSTHLDSYPEFDATHDILKVDAIHKGKDKVVNSLLDQISDSYEYVYDKASALEKDSSNSVLVSFASVFIVFVLCILVLGYIINKNFISVITDLSAKLLRISNGHFDNTFKEFKNNDEISILNTSSKFIQDKMMFLFKDIRTSVESLKLSSSHLNETSELIHKGSEQQSERSEQNATAINEMSATSSDIAKNISNTAIELSKIEDLIKKGTQSVNDSNKKIHDMSSELTSTKSIVEDLDGKIIQINKIVEVISGVSKQTNLLALNAAIEAARAGEQGRGFAVVADEVRSLAQKTQDLVKEIDGIISEIKESSGKSVIAINKTSKYATETVSLMEKFEKDIIEIKGKTEVVSDMSIQIATASEQQSKVAEELTRNIIEISDIAKDNLKHANGVVSVSEKVKTDYININDKIEAFKVE